MNEMIEWIDKDLNDIVGTNAYQQYFSHITPTYEEDRQYFSNNAQGIELILSIEKSVLSIHFFGEKRKDEKSFKGELPLSIKFSFSRKTVQSIFGIPTRSGGGHHQILYGLIPLWDKYILHDFSLHFEYSNDENSISLLTAGSLSLESQLNADLQ
jgi:hypothetical protein